MYGMDGYKYLLINSIFLYMHKRYTVKSSTCSTLDPETSLPPESSNVRTDTADLWPLLFKNKIKQSFEIVVIFKQEKYMYKQSSLTLILSLFFHFTINSMIYFNTFIYYTT